MPAGPAAFSTTRPGACVPVPAFCEVIALTRTAMTRAFLLFAAIAVAACSAKTQTIPGTKVPDTPQNQAIVERVEEYRLAMERQDARALALMASDGYREQASSVGDDYGYDELLDILRERLSQVEDIRYSIRYMDIKREGNLAYVDVLIDASFTIEDARGERVREDMQDQNQLVLEWTGEEWMFLSGM
jgi:hypothetical protein